MEIKLFLICLVISNPIFAEWAKPCFTKPENFKWDWSFNENSLLKTVYISIEEAQKKPVFIAYVHCTNCNDENSIPKIGTFTTGSSSLLGPEIKKKEDNTYQLFINNELDYESKDQKTFKFKLTLQDTMDDLIVQLTVLDIDDTPPRITVEQTPCKTEENKIGETECTYSIYDPDTINDISTVTFKIPDNVKDFFDIHMYKISATKANGVLNVKKKLDFETMPMYYFTLTAVDKGNNEASVPILIEVIDVNDNPPKWIDYFAIKSFEENSTQEFDVRAQDGDLGIDDKILYSWKDDNCETKNITLKPNGNKATIIANYIDRDIPEIDENDNTIKCVLLATEQNAEGYSTPLEISFIIQDINDQYPVITIDNKQLNADGYIELKEEQFVNLENIFSVNDIDQGNNAQYVLEFVNDKNIRSDVYAEAFQIIPTNGYREWSFSISVLKPELLDYEQEHWRDFTLRIESKDKGLKPLKFENEIKIKLLNLNDEIPYFEDETEKNYIVEIPENANVNTYILNVLAKDDDVDDSVKYSLETSGSDFKLVIQKNNSATIYTAKDNVFDYEKIKTVILQISAKDTLEIPHEPVSLHSVTQQITIHVIDVNDEKPRISLPNKIKNIPEHSSFDTVVTDLIKAEDVDTEAKLEFSINWKESFATKLGAPLEDISLFEEVFYITTTYNDGKTGSATGTLKVKNKSKLDYENFEIIYLRIVVTDIPQEINEKTDAGTLAIILDDINDQEPIFDTTTIDAIKIVTEHSNAGVRIGSILATDKDGPKFNNISYFLEPLDATKPDLVKINKKNGELTVDKDKLIDADDPKTCFLNYTVIASDGLGEEDHNTTAIISIEVEDINDNVPELDKELVNDIKINERSKNDKKQFVQTVHGIDKDRDKPRNVVTYAFNNEINPNLRNMFNINQDTGEINANGDIIWTPENEIITVHIIMEDNRGGQGIPNSVKKSFTVTIIDVDDHPPLLPDSIIVQSIKENEESGVKSEIMATDEDKACTDATKIDYSITKIIDTKTNQEVEEEIFELNKKDSSDTKNCPQIAELTIKKSLRGYYGNYIIYVHAENPLNKETNFHDKQYKIFIEPYNFVTPKIIFPSDSRLILRKEQKKGEKLYNLDDKPIKDFEATDNQNDKFIMTFEKGDNWIDEFDLKPSFENKATLILTTDTPSQQDYELKIKARHNGTGSVDNYVDHIFYISFIDKSSLPQFTETLKTISFYENATDERCKTFPKAVDFKCTDKEDCLFITYYHLISVDGIEEQPYFNVDKNQPEICLKQDLDREVIAYHNLTIVSTNLPDPPSRVPANQDPLKLTIEVIDINDNNPVFTNKKIIGGVADIDEINTVIYELLATDPDQVDEGHLRYEIVSNTITVSDSSLETIKNSAFDILPNSNAIINIFQPKQDMTGYFTFDVKVLDTGDNFDTANVKVYIISDLNRITFTFKNDYDTVKAQDVKIAEIFTKVFEYTCSVDKVLKNIDESSGQSLSNETQVKTHFIDETKNEPIEKEILTKKLDDVEVVSSLVVHFKDINLELIDYINKETDEEHEIDGILRTTLIVVSVVLGTLCVILFVAFIIRSRSLTRRLEAMTTNVFGSTKSDINRIGISAPNTNRHAIEANPVWNEDLNNVTQFDTISQDSGGSDLIGIEDKPDFAYDFRRASINPVMQEKMNEISADDDDDINSLPDSYNNRTVF